MLVTANAPIFLVCQWFCVYMWYCLVTDQQWNQRNLKWTDHLSCGSFILWWFYHQTVLIKSQCSWSERQTIYLFILHFRWSNPDFSFIPSSRNKIHMCHVLISISLILGRSQHPPQARLGRCKRQGPVLLNKKSHRKMGLHAVMFIYTKSVHCTIWQCVKTLYPWWTSK